jgi:ribosomal protein S27AE
MNRHAAANVIEKQCPRCGGPLVLVTRYAGLAPRTELLRSGLEGPVRYHPAWVCGSGGCHYREWVDEDR